LRTERRVGISGSFFYVCERAWTLRMGGFYFGGFVWLLELGKILALSCKIR